MISATSAEVKLRVYEWVWINYICNGYEKIEEAGYGADHIIQLSKTGNSYQVISDSYYDIATDCEYGVEEDLAIFESEREEFENAVANSAVSTVAAEASERTATTVDSYNANLAIAYANQWFGGANTGYSTANYNPKYSHYGSYDCCNFVSQCLAAGGMTMSGLWSATVYNNRTTPIEDTTYTDSNEAWRYVPTFMNYWEGRGYYKTQITDVSQAIPGNPIFWLEADGESNNHNMLIVGFNSSGQILYSCHSTNVYGLPINLSAKKYYTIDFAHNFGAYISQGASSHTSSCSLCETTVTGSHDTSGAMVVNSATHSRTCSVCNYVWTAEAHDASGMASNSSTHAISCSDCGYIWPGTEAEHNMYGHYEITSTTHARTCSECGYLWVAYGHNTLGDMIIRSTTHTYVCSTCDYGWKTESHNRDTVTAGTSTHTCVCSDCDYQWSEAHTYVNGRCSVCGVREVIFQSIE